MKLVITYNYRCLFQYYFPWVPIQPCLACKRWFWGGLPFPGWMPAYKTYCSKQCHEESEYW
jgi:hypothetical protein